MAAADDPHIASAEEAAVDAGTQRRFADLFDLRRIIGGLFVVYGLILTVLGFGTSDADMERAAGVNVNLWVGIGMLLVGLVFIVWALLRPVGAELVADDEAGAAEGASRADEDAAGLPAGDRGGQRGGGTGGAGSGSRRAGS